VASRHSPMNTEGAVAFPVWRVRAICARSLIGEATSEPAGMTAVGEVPVAVTFGLALALACALATSVSFLLKQRGAGRLRNCVLCLGPRPTDRPGRRGHRAHLGGGQPHCDRRRRPDLPRFDRDRSGGDRRTDDRVRTRHRRRGPDPRAAPGRRSARQARRRSRRHDRLKQVTGARPTSQSARAPRSGALACELRPLRNSERRFESAAFHAKHCSRPRARRRVAQVNCCVLTQPTGRRSSRIRVGGREKRIGPPIRSLKTAALHGKRRFRCATDVEVGRRPGG
jgi:hypothetical protein